MSCARGRVRHVASAPIIATPARRAPVLVVLPALTWQGANPVDDTGDGLPNTLGAGRSVRLDRPLGQRSAPRFGR